MKVAWPDELSLNAIVLFIKYLIDIGVIFASVKSITLGLISRILASASMLLLSI